MRTHPFGARWPLALLVVAIGLTVVAVYESVRVAVSNEAVAEGVVRDYASFAGWAYARHLEQSLREMGREVLGPINHGEGMHSDPRIPPAEALAHLLYFDEKCQCHKPRIGPPPETFFAYSIKSDTLSFALNTHPKPSEGWEIDRPLAVPVPAGTFTAYAPGDRQMIVRDIRHRVYNTPDHEHGYTYFTADLGIGKRMVVFSLMPTTWGDTIVYGAQYTPAAIVGMLREIIAESDLLPSAFAERTHNMLGISVTDGDGSVMFASNPTPMPEEASSQHPMGVRFANLVVHASIDPSQAGSLVVGGLPRSRLPFLLGALMLAGALTLTAVTLLRRESELGRVRAEWIASVSHELRTPLAQIRLFLDTVRLGRAKNAEQQQWMLSQVDRETTRLSHMIEKVLSFSRMGRGSEPGAHQCDIAAEAATIVNEFRVLADARQVTIETAFGDVPSIPLRKDALRHILLNLLDNAVKYGPSGQTIRITLDRAGEQVILGVADQGPGVPAAERDNVWRPFTRGATSTEQGGSGIGLSIVRELATQHGGRASVTSAPSGGALFTVAFPVGARVA